MTTRAQDAKPSSHERIAVLDGSWALSSSATSKGEAYRAIASRNHPARRRGSDPDLLNLPGRKWCWASTATTSRGRRHRHGRSTLTAKTTIGQATTARGSRVRENVAGAKLARQAAERSRLRRRVSSGPLKSRCHCLPRVDLPGLSARTPRPDLRDLRTIRSRAGVGGVDFLLIETIFDTLNAKRPSAPALEVAPELPLALVHRLGTAAAQPLAART